MTHSTLNYSRIIPAFIAALLAARLVWLAAHTTFITFAHFLLIGGVR